MDRRITLQTTATTPFTRRWNSAPLRLGGQVIYGPGAFILSDDGITVADDDADELDFSGFASGEGLIISGNGQTATVTVTTVGAGAGNFRADFAPEIIAADFGTEISIVYAGRTGGIAVTEKTVWASRRDLSADGLALGALDTPGGELALSTDSVWLLRFRTDISTGGNFRDSAGQIWQIRAVAEVGRRQYVQLVGRKVTA